MPRVSGGTDFAERFRELRARSLLLCEALSVEDQMVQCFDYASPTKWHLAHTSWFFDTFVLRPYCGFREARDWGRLFNSYYEVLGRPHCRAYRGVLSRPSLSEILDYRQRVDEAISKGLQAPSGDNPEMLTLLELGIAHEEQHQELMLTDILANLSLHPEGPAIFPGSAEQAPGSSRFKEAWRAFEGGCVRIGAKEGFYFDHEGPQHDCIVHPFELAQGLVSNAQMLEFIQDGGYRRPEFWLAQGIDWVRRCGATHPRYWRKREGRWLEWTLYGERPLNPGAPLVHVNAYEADALASYLKARLPTEMEWEYAALQGPGPQSARWLGEGPVRPRQNSESLYGEVWNWTRSAYLPYPGYRPRPGAVGEYNGKFMADQWVLRGGSCASPPGHLRASYRNFFAPQHNWQFSGLRLARDLSP